MKTAPRFLRFSTGTLAATCLAAGRLSAADISRADNTSDLNLSGAWTGGVAPGASDNAVWGATVTASRTTSLGADTVWNGIRLSGAVGFQTVSNASSANTLALGAGGIDFTGATAGSGVAGSGLFIQSKVLLSANQNWVVTDSNTATNAASPGPALNQGEDLAFVAQAAGAAFDLGGFTVTKSGAGTVAISSGYNITNGAFVLGTNAGTLVIQSGGSRNTASAASVSVGTGSTLRLQVNSNGSPTTALVQSGGITLAGGTLNLVQNATTANSTLSITGNIAVTGTSTISMTLSPTGSGGQDNPVLISGGVSGSGTLTLNAVAGSLLTKPVIGGVIANNGGTLSLAKTGAGVWTLTGVNTYTGSTTFTAGTLAAGNNAAFGTGLLRFDGGTVASSDATARTFTNANIDYASSGVFGTATTGNLTFTGAVALGNAAAGAKTITVNNARTEFSGVLSSTDSAGTFTKNGSGELVLSGANTYLKKTVVSAGTVTVAASGAIIAASTAGITVASAATLAINGTLTLASASATIDNSGIFTAGGTLNLNNVFDAAPGTTTYNLITGAGTNSGSFTVTGYSTSVFSNVSYNGTTGVLIFTAVPEPSTYGLIGAGALAAVAMVRRRRKASGAV